MATEIAFETSVDIGDSAQSLKSLKQEFKETQKELDGLTVGSQKYVDTLKKLGAIKDEIGDLNQEIKAFNPEGKIQAFGTVVSGLASGFQAATGAVALFGGENKELEKTLVKVQAAMAFADGIKGVVALGDSFAVLTNVMKSTAIGQKIVTALQWAWNAAVDANPIGLLVLGLVSLVAGMKALASATEDAALKQQRLNELQKENEERTETYIVAIKKRLQVAIDANERELALMKAEGASREALLAKEQEINRQKQQMLSYINGYRGQLNEEEKKQQLDLINEKKIKDAEYTKYKADEEEKQNQKYKDELAKRNEEYAKHINEIRRINKEASEQYERDLAEEAQKELERQKEQEDAEALRMFMANEKKIAENNRLMEIRIAQAKQADEQEAQNRFTIAQASNQSLQSLSDIVFSIKQANLKKGSAEELETAKKQFKINKALQLSGAIIDSSKAVMASLASAPLAIGVVPNPVGIASLASVSLASIANIAKIASSQFSESGGGGGSVPTVNAPSGQGVPNVNVPNTSSTQLNEDGTVRSTNNQQTIRAYVVETDVTRSQSRVNSLETASLIG